MQYGVAVFLNSNLAASKQVILRYSSRSRLLRIQLAVVIADLFECSRYDSPSAYFHSHTMIAMVLFSDTLHQT